MIIFITNFKYMRLNFNLVGKRLKGLFCPMSSFPQSSLIQRAELNEIEAPAISVDWQSAITCSGDFDVFIADNAPFVCMKTAITRSFACADAACQCAHIFIYLAHAGVAAG